MRSLDLLSMSCSFILLSVQFSRSVMSDSFRPHELQHASLTITNSWSLLKLTSIELVMPSYHLIPVFPFSSHLQCFPASGSFPMSWFFAIRWAKYWSFSFIISTSNEYSGLISLQSKGLSRVFSNTTVQKHQFFGSQLFL